MIQLSRGRWDSHSGPPAVELTLLNTDLLKNLFIWDHAAQHVGSSFPNQGLNLWPLHWKHGVLTTGPWWKFPQSSSGLLLLSHFSRVRLCVTPQMAAHQAPPSPVKGTWVGCHFLLQGIFPTQGWNLGLPHCWQTLYHLSHQGSLKGKGYIYILRAIFALFTLSLINGNTEQTKL